MGERGEGQREGRAHPARARPRRLRPPRRQELLRIQLGEKEGPDSYERGHANRAHAWSHRHRWGSEGRAGSEGGEDAPRAFLVVFLVLGLGKAAAGGPANSAGRKGGASQR